MLFMQRLLKFLPYPCDTPKKSQWRSKALVDTNFDMSNNMPVRKPVTIYNICILKLLTGTSRKTSTVRLNTELQSWGKFDAMWWMSLSGCIPCQRWRPGWAGLSEPRFLVALKLTIAFILIRRNSFSLLAMMVGAFGLCLMASGKVSTWAWIARGWDSSCSCPHDSSIHPKT